MSVRVYERAVGGPIYREARDAEGRKDRRSLGHRDRALAESQARQLARRLAELRYAGHAGPLTLGQLWALYQQHRFPLLSPARQRGVRGMAALLEQHFGRDFAVDDLSPHHVDAYAAARKSGAVVSPRHRTGAPGVRAGTVRNELHLLAAMLKWAQGHRVRGRRLLTVDPLAGVSVPQEKNARRPVATDARYRACLAVADRVEPGGRFRCMLTIARTTGRRVNAICQLRASDVLLSKEATVRALAAAGQPVAHADAWPHGALRWPAASDKLGFESVAPIAEETRTALEAYLRAHPKVGDAPLFPSTSDDARPVSKVLAGYWLTRAEELAELPHLERGGWHALRRLWASERRHLPAQDVAALGGWRSLQVMRSAYQHADAAGVFSALTATVGAPTDTLRTQAKRKRRYGK